MAVVQSTYATAFPNGYAGMIANGETSNRISRTVEDATAIGFGKAVFRGSGDHGVTATSSFRNGLAKWRRSVSSIISARLLPYL